jgi:hypothetical protein
LKVEEPVQQKRGNPNPTTGMIGVHKMREKYQAQISYGGTNHSLGTFGSGYSGGKFGI